MELAGELEVVRGVMTCGARMYKIGIRLKQRDRDEYEEEDGFSLLIFIRDVQGRTDVYMQ